MAFSVQMPELGESVTEGTVTRWLKQEGDTVEVDEPLVEVSTDKVDTEIPSPAAGVLQKIVAAEDDTVEVGGELAVIGDGSDSNDSDDSDDEEPSDSKDDTETTEEPAEPGESDAEEKTAPQGDAKPAKSGGGTEVTMPELGESVTEGTVTRWLKEVGDEVEVDEPLLEVSTDKVDTEIPSPIAGTLLEQTAAEDDTVEVGGVLAKIGSADEAPNDEAADDEPAESESLDSESAENDSTDEDTPLESEAKEDEQARDQASDKAKDTEDSGAEETAAERPEPKHAPSSRSSAQQGKHRNRDSGTSTPSAAPYVTPLVRKLAGQKDVDLDAVTGTGVGGRIRKQDVLAAAEAQTSAAAEPAAAEAEAAPAPTAGVRPELAALRGTTQKASRIRQITAAKTRESLQNSAQLTQTFEVDMSRIAALRTQAKASFAQQEGVNLTFLPFFAKAVVEALTVHPNVNASFNEESKEITYHGAAHLAIAVDTPQGLLSPVIHNAGDLSLAGLARAIGDLADRTRSNKLKPDELSGGTFTLTNIGSQGALFDTPILIPPQAAMLGTGAIVKRPVVITDELGNDSLAIRSMCFLPLTYDHRLIDGADAGRFLTTVKQRLQEAAFEADLGL